MNWALNTQGLIDKKGTSRNNQRLIKVTTTEYKTREDTESDQGKIQSKSLLRKTK